MDSSADNYKELFGNLSDIVCIINIDEDFTIVYANDAFFNLIGFTVDEVQYKFGSRMSAILEVDTVKQLKNLVLEGQPQYEIIEHAIKASGTETVYLITTVDCSYVEQDSVIYLISKDITKYRKIEKALHKLKQKTDYIYQYSDFDIIEFDYYTGKIQDIWSKLFFNEIVKKGDSFFDCALQTEIVKDSSVEELNDCISKIMDGSPRALCQLQMKDTNDQYKWVMMSLGVQENEGTPYVIGVFTNVTTEKEAALNYLYEALYYQAVLSHQNAYGHVDVTDDKLLRVGGMWGSYNDRLNEKTYTQLFKETIDKSIHPDDREQYWGLVSRENLVYSYENGISNLNGEFRRATNANKMIWMSITIHIFEDPLQHHVLAVMYLKNIDIQKKQRLALEYAASRDSLTKVFNKDIMKERITEYVMNMKKKEACFFLIFDVMNLEQVYEELGNEIGDGVLVKVAKILRISFRKCDMIGRYDRTKFLLYLKDVNHDQGIKDRLDSVVQLLKKESNPEIKIGIGMTAVYVNDFYEKMFERASAALESCKEEGNGGYRFYEGLPETYSNSRVEEKEQKEIERLIFSNTLNVQELSGNFKNEYQDYYPASNDFDQLVGEQGEMCYLVDPITYTMVRANKAFCDRLGMSEEECMEGKCYEIIHHRNVPCPFCQKSNWNTSKYCFYRNYNEVLEQEFLIKNKLVEYNGREMLLAIAVGLPEDSGISDSLGNEATENDYLLSGIHYMQEAADFDGMMVNAMETMGTFFRATSAHFWNLDESGVYVEAFSWHNPGTKQPVGELDAVDKRHVDEWLKEWKGEHIFDVDNQEIMLYHSYSMHELIKKREILNQKWVMLTSQDKQYGFLEINNISANFKANSFVESFANFIASEWKKRVMVDDIIMSNYYDSLTRLLNRTSYENYIRQYNADDRSTMAVILINVNRLGDINDAQGFSTGNKYLWNLAQNLTIVFDRQTIYRTNGDEFVVLLEDIEQNKIEENIAQFRKAMESEEFSVSIGYAFDNVEKNLNKLVDYATQSMRINKKLYYDSVHIDKDEERVDMQKQIIDGIENDLIRVYLQPKVNIEENKVVGAEALIRFFNSSNGFTPPGNTIGTLERMNLIRYIDLFVFGEVCRILDKWKKQGIELPRVSLNFSRMTMMEVDLISTMESILSNYDVDKKNIEIEITESYADIGKALLYQAAKNISDAGYSLSLDDFGTDYTNLSILSELDVDVLKVDRSLVHSLAYRKKDQVILRSVFQMCKNLGVEVIAEGVETKEQEDIVRKLGGNLIQGYLYSKPIAIGDFEKDFLNKNLTR